MLVYGDHSHEAAPAATLARLAGESGRLLNHEQLRHRFLTLAGLAQGVADADFHEGGSDRFRPAELILLEGLTDLARSLMASWEQNCRGGLAPSFRTPAELPARISVRLAEGHAFYALYPEAYGLAARQLVLEAPARVIGLRSIGTGLAAMAAAALGSPPPFTLRPCGNAFARTLRIDPAFAAALLEGEAHYVIVDEGPGLSGSSFGCVADWLEDNGVPPRRIAFLPGHAGPLGPEASTSHRERWAGAQRPVATVDRLRGWVEEVVGPVDRWQDCSAGMWRPLWSASEQDWPPVTPVWERAKFKVRSGRGEWLVRFAGLGRPGGEKLALARLLERAGFGPQVAGLTHGWLIQCWHGEAATTRPRLDEVMAYLRLRSFLPASQGASLSHLVAMVHRNVPALSHWKPPTERLQQQVRPVRIDGRLAAHEWLRLSSGRLLKADALDHHQSHDLIGCQDIAWDVAGAAIELDLAHDEIAELELALAVEPELTAFYRTAYAAFRLGAHRLSETMVGPEEATRHQLAARRFESALVDAVEYPRHIDQPIGLGIEALA